MVQKFFRKIIPIPWGQRGRRGNDVVIERVSLRHGAIDFLYFILGIFTHCYGATLTFLFFANSGAFFPLGVSLMDMLQELYLGGLGVYVVLKEIRKRYHREQSKHWGEYFVGAWLILLVTSSVFVFVSPSYHFDPVYQLIVINSLATLIIFIGGLLNRP